MFQGSVGPSLVYSKATLGPQEIPFLQLSVRAMDVFQLVFTFQATGKFPWSFHIPQNVDAVFLTHNDNVCSAPATDAETHCQSCLLRANATGTLTVIATPDLVTLLQTAMSNVVFMARKIGQASPDPPTSAPWFDPQNWAQTVSNLNGRTQKWVENYKVQYAVSFYNESQESVKGPWSDWIEGTPWALPTLVNVPVGPSYVAGRKIYRQFAGFPEELVVTLSNNTDTRCPEYNL